MSKLPLILKIAIPSPLRSSFDYLPPKEQNIIELKPGMRVRVPFGNRKLVGILLETTDKSQIDSSQLKHAIEILDKKPILPKEIIKLNNWASEYYHHSIGEIMLNSLPTALRKGKSAQPVEAKPYFRPANNHSPLPGNPLLQLNNAQQQAVDSINAGQGFNTFLLYGITGSGKTEVYLHAIEKIINSGKQALVLIPEIGLTLQTLARFQNKFPVNIAVFHSRLTDRERLQAWMMAKEGLAPIIIGTRSAIFTPLANPGIIVLDEEHDLSFKQQSGFRYSARDLASVRGKLENIPVILGSATPSLESMHNAWNNRYQLLKLPKRAGNATHPNFHIIDMRNQKLTGGLSEKLISEIQKHLERDGQILLFLNRRGYAPTLLCHSCGWVAECNNCDARMTMHYLPNHLHCHHCGSVRPIYTTCPKCNGDQLMPLGMGTERLEETLKDIFPTAVLTRIDRDSTSKKGSMQKMLNDIHNNNFQILIGTQMLAKGHHFPNVSMSVILNADNGLLSSDFRAGEHIAQLIMQVAGRAGRAEKTGEVYIQTYNPHHRLLLTLIQKGYLQFAKENLKERQLAGLPPFTYFALLKAESKNQTAAMQFLNEIKAKPVNAKAGNIKLLGPIPAHMQRKANFYRAQLLVSSKNRKSLHNFLELLIQTIDKHKPAAKIRWFIDIDPVEVL